MEQELIFKASIPWPPSVNGYWRAFSQGGKVRNILSARGREYRAQVMAAALLAGCRMAGKPKFPEWVRVACEIDLYPPDLRRRDLDNHVKAVLDGLTKANLWADDSQVDVLVVRRGPVIKGGLAMVQVMAVD